MAGAGLAPALPTSGGGPPAVVETPFLVEVNKVGVSSMVNSLVIDVELGRYGEASFDLTGLSAMPAIGHAVRIFYFRQLIFAGAIDNVDITTEPSQSHTSISCSCTDHSYLLFRQKIKETYTNQTIGNIATSLVSNYLFHDGVRVGRVDVSTPIPVANAEWVSIFEFLSELATSVGAVFYIDYDKKLHFISTTVAPSGTPLTASNMEQVSMKFDRENYRNEQTTTVTGTPPEGVSAVVVELTRRNDEQIDERMNVEDTSGYYNDHLAVTHPTSNDAVVLTSLAQAYNKIALGLSGSLRRTVSVRTRQYDYQAGQFVSMTLDYLGISGTWVIQRLRLTEEAGMFLVAEMELTQSSLMRRAQELWLDVVRKGTIAILPPSAIYQHRVTQSVLGFGIWQVPAGITDVQVTCYGGGGGGGGGARSEWPALGPVQMADGARGGAGGVTISILTVNPGDVLSFWVGAGGAGGPGEYRFQSFLDAKGTNGTNGSDSWVARNGGSRVGQANGGSGGIGGAANAARHFSNTVPDGLGGAGLYGTVVTVGGASNGGSKGLGYNNSAGRDGLSGRVVMEW
jgi:hypothetical protein